MEPSIVSSPRRSAEGRSLWLLTTGAILLAVLIASNDAPRVIDTLAGAGFGILIVVAAHLPQTLCAALGWRALFDREVRPRIGVSYWLRWVKESVNALLPVAQVGGDLVRAKLAAGPRLPLKTTAASCLVDVLLSVVSLIAFAAVGLAVVIARAADEKVATIGFQLLGLGAVVALAAILSHRAGALRLLESAFGRPTGTLGRLSGLHDAVSELCRHPRRLAGAAAWHLTSWSLGVVETYAALWVLGFEPSLEQALVIESLGQAVRALGFAIPGALGVQEGGYILICAMFGIPPPAALALSLVRRVRELALGLPGLIAWRAGVTRRLSRAAAGAAE